MRLSANPRGSRLYQRTGYGGRVPKYTWGTAEHRYVLGTTPQNWRSETMAIVSEFISPVLFVRWKGTCSAADVPEIQRLTEQAAARAPAGLIYISVIPIDVPPPDAEARAALRDGVDHSSLYCRSVHIVIEGEGMRRALIRSISAGLLLATRKTSKGFHIHETVEQAIAAAFEGSREGQMVLQRAEAGVLRATA